MSATGQHGAVVVQRAESLLEVYYRALVRFPKSEKHILAAEIRKTLYGLMRNLVLAAKLPSKAVSLNAADAELSLLNVQTRLAMKLGYLQMPKYEEISRITTEIGKMIGGWIRKS